ncbi:MAG: energy transducer TonB [Acidobacteriota bacterium]
MNKLFFISALIFLTNFIVFTQTPTTTPKTIISGVVNGKATDLPKPTYPEFAKSQKIKGKVEVRVTIDEQGNVISAKAISGPAELRKPSEKAALASKFSPTIIQGEPYKVTGVIIYNFQPKEQPVSNEEKLKFMGMGVFLVVAKIMPMSEWETLPEKELENETILKETLMPLTKITPQTNKEEQIQILNQVAAKLEKVLTGNEAWQYQLGKEFGGLMIEIQKVRSNHSINFDETIIKSKLLNMKELLAVSPSDLPANLYNKFNEITKLSDAANLNSDENKAKFLQLIGEILDIVSPN